MGSHPSLGFARRGARGMTLIEIVLALSILALSLGGILAALLQSRRLTEGSVIQNSAMTVVQGYMEQIKNMDLCTVVNSGGKDPSAGGVPLLTNSYTIATRYKEPPTSGADDGTDPLLTTPGGPPDLSTLTPGVTPSGVVDNLKDFPDNTGPAGTALAWSTLWPGARSFPTADPNVKTSTAYPTDLHLNIWVWVQDLTATTPNATMVYGITMIYTWQYQDGNKTKYIMGTVRSMRSDVPTD
ncbi:MAG TPA: prepilin-type N-terminal cleavage/methylation domain-containing protein [Opitutaceae bacterium]|nr:prepilin-type N-terminal cleavage/methylation domain-containing protein [Opitutaceae bacterium]